MVNLSAEKISNLIYKYKYQRFLKMFQIVKIKKKLMPKVLIYNKIKMFKKIQNKIKY